MPINRRQTFLLAAAAPALSLLPAWPASAATDTLTAKLDDLARRLKARVGVAIVDDEKGQTFGYKADERFPLASTFKALASAAVLANVDSGKDKLVRRVTFAANDVVTYSPVTEKRVADGMTLAEVCEAAITISDNTAGNLLLKSIGGPEGFTAFMRSIGDSVTRIDRWETDLNEGKPGDLRDTTTPRAVVATLHKLAFGDVLSPASRKQLLDWMIADKVADALLRAGIPKDWRIGDKSGAGGNGARGIIAVMWPPGRKPLTAAIYLTETEASFDARNAAIAEIGSVLQAAFAA